MSCRYESMHHLGQQDIVTSSYGLLNLKNWFLKNDVTNFEFICAYLAYWWSILSEILICCSSKYSLSIYPMSEFRLEDVFMVKISIKG